MLHKLGHDTIAFDWSQFHPRAAFLCMPAVALPLIVGRWFLPQYTAQCLMLAAGAFSVGFGSFQELRRSRVLPMFLAAVGMCLSSWVGALAGLSGIGMILVCALWGFLYGIVWTRNPTISWLALQCVVWLIVSTAYPAKGSHALTRGSLVFAGGLFQIVWVVAFWRILGKVTPVIGSTALATNQASNPRAIYNAVLEPGQHRLEGIRLAATLALAAALDRWLALPNAYWIPMTAAIIMRPDFQQTFQRGIARILGTLAGAVVATLVAAILRPSPWILVVLVVMFAYLCQALAFVNYATFAVCLTSYVVFLLALAGLPAPEVVAHRVVNTVAGGTYALVLHAIFSQIERTRVVKRNIGGIS